MHARNPQMDLAAPADWLTALLREPAESQRVASGGSEVELLIWGQRGLPGLFLLHGAGAHAHWWAGVAPLLARHYRDAAVTLPRSEETTSELQSPMRISHSACC